ncbi:MAG: TerB family tellurite resistance protein [Prevotella sp.]|nr:TerB family tellurite resistance protein [Prevotella sp.]
MSIITKFLAVVTEPQFKLARDITAMVVADGEITPEEKEAMSTICHLEGVDEKKLLDALRGGYDNVGEEMPKTRHDKEGYLRDVIRLIGADGYAAPQEVYLFQIIASRMGLNQMDVISMFLLTATRQYFKGDMGTRIFASFLRNYIDPKGKTEKDNRENLRIIYNTVASNTEMSQDAEVDKEILRQTLARATETFLENKILIKGFNDVGLDFTVMVKQEELNIFKRYTL